MARARATVAAVVVTALACGCGGSPSAEDRAAAMRGWAEDAAAACERAQAPIHDRRRPRDVTGLDGYVRPSVADLRKTIAAVRRVPVPEGAAEPAGRAVRALRSAEPELRAIERAAGGEDYDALAKAAKRLESRGDTIAREMRRARLGHCWTEDRGRLVSDMILAPIFAEKFDALQRALADDIEAEHRRMRTGSPAGVARTFNRMSDRFAEARVSLENLVEPSHAVGWLYGELLTDMSGFLAQTADRLDGRTPPGPQFFAALQRRFKRFTREEKRAVASLYQTLGSLPAPKPRSGDEAPEQPA